MKLIYVQGLRRQKAILRFNSHLLFALIGTMAVKHEAVSHNNNIINTKIDILTPNTIKFQARGWTLYVSASGDFTVNTRQPKGSFYEIT